MGFKDGENRVLTSKRNQFEHTLSLIQIRKLTFLMWTVPCQRFIEGEQPITSIVAVLLSPSGSWGRERPLNLFIDHSD